MTATGQTQIRTPELAPEVMDLRRVQSQGALSASDPNRLMAAYLELDQHDIYVTSRSVLGFRDGQRFLEVISRQGPQLVDPPITIEA